MPKVSVIMAAYNVEPYIEKAVQSLLAQTMRDIQIVAVNDCSTDHTLAVLERLASNDDRVTILSTPKNSGAAAARNYGLPYCTSDYIACLDADDFAMPTRFEKQIAFLEANPAVGLVGTAVVMVDVSDRPLATVTAPRTPDLVKRTMLLASPAKHSSWLVRREIYDKLNGYRIMKVAQDYDFLLRTITLGWQVANLPEALVALRLRPGNITELYTLQQRKAHKYIVSLYKMRLTNGGNDGFTAEGYDRATQCGLVESASMRIAERWSRRALTQRNRIFAPFLILGAALVSPWQAQYCWNRLRVMIMLQLSR
ncbi:MAG: glycosyltransferase family 2 protein [Capsulimonadaceae bacterium]|nr:glycosyltransferase family 2 protein [Capsulimonadaceae bacterium]